MSVYLGLDIGTSHITALGLDIGSGDVLAMCSLPNTSEITSAADRTRGRSEWEAAEMLRLAWTAIKGAVSQLPRPLEVRGIGVCGQMHGMCVVSSALLPLTPFIGWQDQRGHEHVGPGRLTYVDQSNKLVGSGEGKLATGFMGLSLFWLRENDCDFPTRAKACFISDFMVAWLTGEPLVTDPTNAESSGLYDTRSSRWAEPVIRRLGLCPDLLPPIRRAPTIGGHLRPSLAQEAGIPPGIPVAVAIGDNQASFAGSVAVYARSLSLAIGTGGQLSAHTTEYRQDAGLDTRPYIGGSYLLVAAELCGGRAFSLLRDFFQAVGRELFGITPPQDLYDRMNALAAAAPVGSAGLTCEPMFTGTRSEPFRTGLWAGLTPANLRPGHMTRALLEGLIGAFAQQYQRMRHLGITCRENLVASGNALRRNRLLCQIAGDTFQMPVLIPQHTEEAAFGAALVAAVSAGALSDIGCAGRLIRYLEVAP